MKLLLGCTILLVILVAGCTTEQPSEVKQIDKTALISYTEFFCYFTEQSAPYAYFSFAYQENGEIESVKTKTTCNDLVRLGVSNEASKNQPLFGEQIKLIFTGDRPTKIIRENGDIYEVEESELIRSFFTSPITIYDNLNYFRNSNSGKVIEECLLINQDNKHDRCLSYQAEFLQDDTICNKMKINANQDLCKQAVQNLKTVEIVELCEVEN